MLQAAALLLITGPGLEGVLGAISLYVAGVSLGSGRHAMMWSAAVLAMALQWIVRAADPYGGPTSIAILMSNILSVAAPILYAQGFRLRRGDQPREPAFVGLAVLAIVAVIALSFTVDGGVVGIVLPWLRVLFLIIALARLFMPHRRASPAEITIALMTGVIIVLSAGVSYVWFQAMLGGPSSHDRMIMTGLTASPPSAALAILTLLLIASDYARQRRAIVHTDPLTGILNRLGLAETARGTRHRRSRPISVAIADIDYFKAVNDRFGHGAGDAVLTDFAACLAGQLRPGEIAARVGGEEFALVLHGRHEAALERIEEMRRLVSERRLKGYPDITITASFGLAEHRRGETLDGAMGRADAALYRSKREGRNRSTLAEPVRP